MLHFLFEKDGRNVSRVTTVLFFPFKFFLMERAGRRRLLLTGFISIAVCNLLMTIVDSVLVRSFCVILFFHFVLEKLHSRYLMFDHPAVQFVKMTLKQTLVQFIE